MLAAVTRIRRADAKHTLVIDLRDPHWIPTPRDTYFGKIGRNRLECKCHVGSSGGLNRKCLLSPKFVNIFV